MKKNKYPRPLFKRNEIVIYNVPNHPDYGALGIVVEVYNANIAEGYIGSEHEYDVQFHENENGYCDTALTTPCYERNLMKV